MRGRALEHKPPGAWTPSWVEVPGPPVAETAFPPEMGAERIGSSVGEGVIPQGREGAQQFWF